MRLDARIKLTRQMEATAGDGSLSPEVLMIGEVSAAVEIVSSVESERAAIQTADFKVRASPATLSVRMQDRVEWQGKCYAIESITPDRIDRPKWLTFRGATSQDGSASGMRGTPYQEPAPTTLSVVIGTVTTGEPGTDAEAEITGSAPTFTLNLTIPRGADGADGGGSGSSTWAGPNTFQVRLASGTGAPALITIGSQFSMSGNTLSLATEYAAASTVSALASDVSALSSSVSSSLSAKADKSTTISATGLATGGGDLSTGRRISVPAASGAEVITGTDTAKAVTSAAIAGARSIGGATSDEGKLAVFAADGSLRCATSFSVFNGAHEHTFLSAATAARAVTFPDKGGTVAMLDDVGGSADWSEVVKAADTTRTATTTLAADPDLVVPIGANKCVRIVASIFFDTTGPADFKFGHTSPSGATVRLAREGVGGGGTALTAIVVDTANNTAGAAVLGSGVSGHVWFEAVINNGATAGDFVLTWAQNASDPGNTKVLKGSYLRYKSD